MFEKEAKEYATRPILYGTHTWKAEEQAFKDGAEFGYNKAKKDINVATRWHKVADGDLPPLGKDCVRASIKVLDDYRRVIAYDYGKECWRDCMGDPLDLQPGFWCEIPICTEE